RSRCTARGSYLTAAHQRRKWGDRALSCNRRSIEHASAAQVPFGANEHLAVQLVRQITRAVEVTRLDSESGDLFQQIQLPIASGATQGEQIIARNERQLC